jgi:hypothetical protein
MSSEESSMGVVMGKMKEIYMDIQTAMLLASLDLSKEVTLDNPETMEATMKKVIDDLNQCVDLMKYIRS